MTNEQQIETREHLTKARDSLAMAISDLQTARAAALPIDEIILSDILRRAVDTRDKFQQYLNAQYVQSAGGWKALSETVNRPTAEK